jgi:hypothetical protein
MNIIRVIKRERLLPNEAEPFLLGHMVDGDLFKEAAGDGGLARAEHVYLEANFDLLGERPLREHRLHLQHERARVFASQLPSVVDPDPLPSHKLDP